MKRVFEDILSSRIQEKCPLIQVVIGPRQVGKTTGTRAVFDTFRGEKFYHSADSPAPTSGEWLEARWLQARATEAPVLLVIDEVQKISGWSEIVKKMFDQDRNKRDLKVVLLGSASLSLQTGLRESLAGRFELLRVNHWNLAEHASAFGWNLEQFLKFGGYPAPAPFAGDKDRWRSYLRDSIIEPVLGRDIMGAVSIAKPVLFRQTFEIAIRYPAQELSYQKIVGQLQERGSTQTVKHYLHILEEAFLIRQIFKYSSRPLSTRESSPKLISLAPALCHAFVDPARVESDPDWRGRIFESVVGAALSRSPGELYYWREKNYEVDYILEVDDKLFAIEVKSGRSTRCRGIDIFLRRFPHAKPVVITSANYQNLFSDKDTLSTLDSLSAEANGIS